MTDEDLRKANALREEIKELEYFIWKAENVWTGIIIKLESKYIIKANAYGAMGAAEFNMNTTIKNRVLGVLKEYLSELKQQLASI